MPTANPSASMPIVDFDGLLGNLDRQGALYDTLLALSDQEREAIGRADLTMLAQLVATKEQVIAEAQQLEQSRVAACAQWAQQWGLTETPTLSDMRAHVSAPAQVARLDAAAIALSRRVQRLRQVNQRNAHLIIQAQRLGEQTISVALRFGHHPTYDHHGDTAASKRPSMILDYRV